MDQPIMTVVVLAYNVERYLEETLDSICSQTLEDIEIIIVDDASTDGTSRIALTYAERDVRIRVITHKENKKCLAAHTSGIKIAHGKYCTVVAGDDRLAPETCTLCLESFLAQDCDIVHFGFNPFPNEGAVLSEEDRQSILAFMQPNMENIIQGKNIGTSCFVEEKISWNIAGKFIKTDLLKKATGYLDELALNFAEDCYIFYYVCHLAETYIGLPDTDFYEYRIGSGISQNKRLDIERFDQACQSNSIFISMENFIKQHNLESSEEATWFKAAHDRVYNDLLERFNGYVLQGQGSQAFGIFTEYWPQDETIARMAETQWIPTETLACEMAKFYGNEKNSASDSQNVAIICDKNIIEDQKELLIPFLAKLKEVGIGRTLFLVEDDFDDEADLLLIDDDIACIRLPFFGNNECLSWVDRIKSIQGQIVERKIDIVVSLCSCRPLFLWDILAVRLVGASFVAIKKEITPFPTDWPSFTYLHQRFEEPFALMNANGIACMSSVANFWSCFCRNVIAWDNVCADDLIDLLNASDVSCCSENLSAIQQCDMWMALFSNVKQLLLSQGSCWEKVYRETVVNYNDLEIKMNEAEQETKAILESKKYRAGSVVLFIPSYLKNVYKKTNS